MNPEAFALLLELLELPKGATEDDALAAVRKVRSTMRSLTESEDGDEARAAILAATSRLSKLTGATTLGGAVNVVEQRFALLADHEKTIEDERGKRKSLEMSDYRALTGELVKLGAEIPATAWQDEKGTLPVQRILDEPLVRLRDRVERLKAAGGGHRLVPLAQGFELSERELAECERKKIDPAVYQRFRKNVAARAGGAREEAS